MFDLTWTSWALIGLGCFAIGLGKTGVPGINIFFVPLLATILPARASTGFLLPMLIFADLFAVTYYRRHAQWRHLLRLLPSALVGIVIGYFGLRFFSDAQLRPIIGVIVLIMLAVQVIRSRKPEEETHIPQGAWFSMLMGLLAGVTTMMANAAGPVMAIYLLTMRLPKQEYVGTGAWFFFLVNLIKVPFSASLGLITLETLKVNAVLTPAIALGAVMGILLLKVLPQRIFRIIVQVVAAVSAVRLLF
jgi:uncharacterized membrane protein YfcA